MGSRKKKGNITRTERERASTKSKEEETSEPKVKSDRTPRSSQSQDTKTLRIIPPDIKDKRVIKQVRSMKVLTPYSVASRFNIRLSVARDLLESLQSQGVITYVSGNRHLRIYRPSE